MRPGGFKPGISGNPGGRSRAYAAMSRRILELSENGAELVDFLFEIMRSDKQETKMRVHCAELLLDRGLGKTPQSIDLAVETTAKAIDLSTLNLTTAQLDELEQAAQLADDSHD